MQSWNLIVHPVRCVHAVAFGRRTAARARARDASLAEVRQVMLAATVGASAENIASITRRIQNAEDLADLWFLRTDLMVALASSVGEQPAQQAMVQISDRFAGLLPKCLSPRPSPLAG